MKLGTETGSLVNHIATHGLTDATPSIGDGATIYAWSDRSAATVVSVDVQRDIVGIQRDHAKRTDDRGMSDMQDYHYTPNPDSYVEHYRRDKKTRGWRSVEKSAETGRWRWSNQAGGIRFGHRDAHYDYTF